MLISNRCMVLFPTFIKNLERYLTRMHTVHINHQVSLDRLHSMAHNEIQSRSLMINIKNLQRLYYLLKIVN